MVFGSLISNSTGNTSRYSQAARSYQPDWQRAYQRAGATTNVGAVSAGRAASAAINLIAASQPVAITDPVTLKTTIIAGSNLSTTANILAQTSSKILIAAKHYEQVAIQTQLSRLGDPVDRLRRENPLYRAPKKDPIPQLRSRARNFISRLKAFQAPTKSLGNPFPKSAERAGENRVFTEDFVGLRRDYDLTQRFPLRVSLGRGSNFGFEDKLRNTASNVTPTHVAVKLHGGISQRGYTIQKDPVGVLEIYDSATDTVIRQLDINKTETLTFAEFQQLRYQLEDDIETNKLDYLNFVALQDNNGDGQFNDVSDRRGGYEEVAIAVNGLERNQKITGQEQFKGNYLNEKNSRFNTAIVNLEGDFVGSDALTDYQNGDLTLKVTEAGHDRNRAQLDETKSSGNKLVFKFDYAYDGITFTAKYADNESKNTKITKAIVTLD